jgi:hypothetical protein
VGWVLGKADMVVGGGGETVVVGRVREKASCARPASHSMGTGLGVSLALTPCRRVSDLHESVSQIHVHVWACIPRVQCLLLVWLSLMCVFVSVCVCMLSSGMPPCPAARAGPAWAGLRPRQWA